MKNFDFVKINSQTAVQKGSILGCCFALFIGCLLVVVCWLEILTIYLVVGCWLELLTINI
ncbi:hypothetical protein CEN44_04400 [Fischerella muscicola CCMEE 5323]|uniref:Uncharacterized protein n=1 Tax=Fischerella muscicola CCMEE 5323 TaxID=2019572 RepID=A0A2N6K784_FISMU|nr:hypothetical protein CEN44_04400 [Fischerella muscicola CCMEE 5323]